MTAATALALSLAGCGVPDLQAMQPTVKKPTAVVVFVNHPAHWQSADVDAVAQKTGIVVKTTSTSSKQVSTTLAQATANEKVGFVVVVQNGDIPDSELAFARSHPQISFAIFGAELKSASGSSNVREVVPDTTATSYSLGTLAGDLATSVQSASIGWLTGGQPVSLQSDVRTALVGAYTANPGLNMVSIPQSGLAASVGGGSGAGSNATNSIGNITGNSTGNSVLSGLGGTSTQTPPGLTGLNPPFPRVVVSTQPLNPSQMATLKAAGVLVVSLCEQIDGNNIAGEPAVPGIDAMEQVFTDYSSHRQGSSVIASTSAPLIAFDDKQVPSAVQSEVTSVELSLPSQVTPLRNGWRTLPTQLQSTWAPIVAQAGRTPS